MSGRDLASRFEFIRFICGAPSGSGAEVEIAYRSGADRAPVRFATTLDGRASALAAIR